MNSKTTSPYHRLIAPTLLSFLLLSSYSESAYCDLFEEAVSGTTEKSESEDGEKASSGSKWVFDFNGFMRGDVFVGKKVDEAKAELKNAYGEIGLKLKASKPSCATAYGDIRLKFGYLKSDYLGEPMGADPTAIEPGLPRYSLAVSELEINTEVRELYMSFYLGPLDLKVGHQIIVWGRADGINPTNNLTPVDLRVRSPEEDDRRMGNLALRANLNFSPFRLEGVFIPIYAPSYMPHIQLMDGVQFTDPVFPERDLHIDSILLAGRAHLIFPAFEMSLSYLHGNAPLPGIVSDSFQLSDPDQPVHVTVKRTSYVQHVVGMDFSTTIGDFMGLRGEVAYRHPDAFTSKVTLEESPDPYQLGYYEDYSHRIHVPNPDLYYVLGADKEFGPVSVIAQYIGKYVFDLETIPNSDDFLFDLTGQDVDMNLEDLQSIAEDLSWVQDNIKQQVIWRELRGTNRLIHGQTEDVQHAASLRVSWLTLHDQLNLVAFAMMNFSTKEWLVYPKVKYAITDAMALAVGAEIYRGPEGTLFNWIEEVLTAGYAEFKYSF